MPSTSRDPYPRVLLCVLAAILGGGLTVAGAAPAAAHGQLAVSTPVKDSRVDRPLGYLELYFTEQPPPYAYFSVTSPSGVRVEEGWVPGETTRLDEPVTELFLVDGTWEPRSYPTGFGVLVEMSHWPEPGVYTADWSSVASDGEEVTGSLTFSYTGAPTAAPDGWTAPTEGPSAELTQALAAAEGGGRDTGETVTGPPAAPGTDGADVGASTEPAAPVTDWLLPVLLVAAAGVVVLLVALRPGRPRPARTGAGRPRRR